MDKNGINNNSEQTSLKLAPLSRTLILWFMLLAMLPMTLVSWSSYQQAHKHLFQAAQESLEQSASSKVDFINNWFTYRVMDLEIQTQDQYHVATLMQLKEGLRQSDNSASEYIKSDDWAQIIGKSQYNLTAMHRIYDYVYDLFLLDAEGNILYSLMHESDLGSNLFTGTLANTQFAKSAQRTIETGRASFSDIEYYLPSNNRLATFLSAPLFDEQGSQIGIFAIQMQLDKIFKKINSFDNNSSTTQSLTHYLIGTDNLLRSSISGTNEDVLIRTIDTEQSHLWQSNQTHLKQPDKQEHTTSSYIGPNKDVVIGLHQALNIPGGHSWALISEINRDEALAAANWLGSSTLLLVLFTGLLAACLAFYQARRITRPIIHLAEASMLVAEGKLDQQVELGMHNEIGQLAESFNYMIVMRKCHEQLLKKREDEACNALKALSEQQFALDQHSIVAITDLLGNITFVNDLFCAISGYTENELLGKNHRILNSGKQDEKFWVDMFSTITNGNVFHGEICNKAKDGHEYWVDTTIVPFFGDDSTSSRYIAIRTDITEIKQTELRLNEAKIAAESASLAKSEFLANMSHEIRTPMNGVIGMTNLLLSTPLNENQHAYAKTVKNSAESLLTIINDILDFSKVEAGMLEVESIEFDMSRILHDFGRSIAFRAHEKGLELICPAEPIQHQWFNSDPGRIRQIFTNLVSNAIKFTQEGEVALHHRVLEQSPLHTKLLFEITDTGIGLNEEQQSKLFERFNQADGSTTRKYGGTGLGLAISKQLVELMGGEIGVKSKVGQGSTFWFTLNLDNIKSKVLPITSDINEQKILIVDDNLTNRILLEQLLTSWKVEHSSANSGADALKELSLAAKECKPFDIAIIDMQMPEMDGIQLGQLIKSDHTVSKTCLVMLTSQGGQGDATKFNKVGFDAYLNKPVDQSVLYNTLLKVSGSQEQNSALITAYNAHQKVQFKARILIVEDNITNQLVAESLLEEFGIQPDMTANGEEAIKALETIPYDLVFMDCQMPVLDGYKATKLIRHSQSKVLNKDIPIIAMTANAMQGDREKCLASGMNDFISKPVESNKILSALQNWLPENNRIDFKTVTKNLLKQPAINTEKSTKIIFDFPAMSLRLMNNKDLIHSVISTFTHDMNLQIKLLKTAVMDNDFVMAATQAHKIKGASANVSGIALCDLALQVENASKSEDPHVLHKMLPEVEDSFALLKTAMQEKL